jgi:uracil-DNA glycosylase
LSLVAAPALEGFYAELAACRRCSLAGYPVAPRPICSGHPGAVFMTVGQAPGRHEAEVTGMPFSGPAGRRLFSCLAEAGFAGDWFRATQAMAAITRCYPGPHPAGRGDRVPTATERGLCADWLDRELALIQPQVLLLVGRLAIDRFLPGEGALTDLVGRQFERGGPHLIPLPHPSGASQWFNQPGNGVHLGNALALLSRWRQDLLPDNRSGTGQG